MRCSNGALITSDTTSYGRAVGDLSVIKPARVEVKQRCRFSRGLARSIYFFFVLSSGVLKDYLRELPYPLITKHLYEAVLESMATRPLRMGAAGCENDQADSEHTVSLLDSLPEVERVRMT